MYRKGATIKIGRSSTDDRSDSLLQMVPNGRFYTKSESQNGIKVNKDGQSYIFNMDSFKRKLERLHKKRDVLVAKLEQEKNDLEEIAQTMQNLYYDQESYAKLMKEIRERFHDVKNPRPGTVAARFVGCFRSSDGANLSNKGCDPSCAGSLAPTDDVKNYAPCEDMVLLFENGTFTSLRDGTGEHAYISINHGQHFSKDHIEMLKSAGLTKVTLIVTSDDDNARESRGPIAIHDLHKTFMNMNVILGK